MSEIRETFYSLFWQSKSCQNLFLMSKEELLDTRTFDFGEEKKTVTYPRILISNVNKADDQLATIKERNEYGIEKSSYSLGSNIQKFQPYVLSFIENRFGKALEKLNSTIENNPSYLIKIIFKVLTSRPEKQEKIFIDELKKLGFFGENVKNFEELTAFFKKEIFTKNINDIFSEENILNYREIVRAIKENYTNSNYKSYYDSNQILVNSLFSDENFEDRLQLFDKLYENKIIKSSNDDTFVECTNCPPGSYKGNLLLNTNPAKLKNLKCPLCNKPLNYYAPYELNSEIYWIIKQKDGLLIDALKNILEQNKIDYDTNLNVLNDVEIDCAFVQNNNKYIVECKMYKLNTDEKKLKHKINKHFGKLKEDIERLIENNKITNKINPVLLVNIPDYEFVEEIENELHTNNKDEISKSIRIMTIQKLKEVLKR